MMSAKPASSMHVDTGNMEEQCANDNAITRQLETPPPKRYAMASPKTIYTSDCTYTPYSCSTSASNLGDHDQHGRGAVDWDDLESIRDTPFVRSSARQHHDDGEEEVGDDAVDHIQSPPSTPVDVNISSSEVLNTFPLILILILTHTTA